MSNKCPLVIAHRGYSSEFPENTMLAFREGMKAGADGFECDLRLSADGKVVVFHDDDLKRLCGISGKIENLPWSEIKKLKVKGSSEKIPSLDELLEEFHTSLINLEIKPSARDAAILVESVLRTLTKIRPQGRLLISSFSPEVLKNLRQMDPSKKMAEVGVLVEAKDLGRLSDFSAEIEADTWNVPRQILSQKKQNFDSSLKPLWLWTLDTKADWQLAIDSSMEVAAIITNKPAALREYLK